MASKSEVDPVKQNIEPPLCEIYNVYDKKEIKMEFLLDKETIQTDIQIFFR